MRISPNRCIGVQRQCCWEVMDRFIGKVIIQKVEEKFRFQGQTIAASYCNRSWCPAHKEYATPRPQSDDTIPCALSLHEMRFRNGQIKQNHPCTGTLLWQPLWLWTSLYCLGVQGAGDQDLFPSLPCNSVAHFCLSSITAGNETSWWET